MDIFLEDIKRTMNQRIRNKTERSTKDQPSTDEQPIVTERKSFLKRFEEEYIVHQSHELSKPNESIRIETELCDLIDRATTLEVTRTRQYRNQDSEGIRSHRTKKQLTKLEHTPAQVIRKSELTINNFFQRPQ